MTATPTIATCPRCQAKGTIFVRSDDGTDLVCQSCREDRPLANPTQAPSSRQLFGSGAGARR